MVISFIMIICISDVAENFKCDNLTATKITSLLLKSSNVSLFERTAEFSFAGVRYSLYKLPHEWMMVRSTITMGETIDDLLK